MGFLSGPSLLHSNTCTTDVRNTLEWKKFRLLVASGLVYSHLQLSVTVCTKIALILKN